MHGVVAMGKAVEAIQKGEVEKLARLLDEDPGLVGRRIDGQRTLLHVATDWPGHFPRVRETIALLAARGADLNPAFEGASHHREGPLHWAASSDDLEALNALLDAGADIEMPGAVIGGGAPLSDAVAFRNWRCARRLVERGAKTTIWQAAALGLLEQVEGHFREGPVEGREVTNAFWASCDGGQLKVAEYLLARGADVNWVGHDGLTPLDVARRGGYRELVRWLEERGAVARGNR